MAVLTSRTGRHQQRYCNGSRLIAGCIPYRYSKKHDDIEIEVLLVSSPKGNGVSFPKGGWERDESLRDAVIREALEEAGVKGTIGALLGEWHFRSKTHQDAYRIGYMFPLYVTEQLHSWPEEDARQRRWVSATEARNSCHYAWMKEALDILVSTLATTSSLTYDI